jgi:hypothetical protein
MTETNCSLCRNIVKSAGLCFWCDRKMHSQIDDLYVFWKAAHDELLPGKSGSGGRSSERTIGLNVNALSWVAGDDILGFLHEWEKLIREARGLMPPALVPRKPTLEDEIKEAVHFARVHLSWSGRQEWINDFAEELKVIHSMGKSAAKAFSEKVARIPCPCTLGDGSFCGYKLKVNKDDPFASFRCPTCESDWNTLRLIAVALSNTSTPVWLDSEAIAGYVNMTVRNVQQFAKRNSIERRGEMYNLQQFVAIRKTAI